MIEKLQKTMEKWIMTGITMFNLQEIAAFINGFLQMMGNS